MMKKHKHVLAKGVAVFNSKLREHLEEEANQMDNAFARAGACYPLGWMHKSGQGVTVDYCKVRDYLEKAANQSHHEDAKKAPRYYLGMMFK